jgi:hypothetical protein
MASTSAILAPQASCFHCPSAERSAVQRRAAEGAKGRTRPSDCSGGLASFGCARRRSIENVNAPPREESAGNQRADVYLVRAESENSDRHHRKDSEAFEYAEYEKNPATNGVEPPVST